MERSLAAAQAEAREREASSRERGIDALHARVCARHARGLLRLVLVDWSRVVRGQLRGRKTLDRTRRRWQSEHMRYALNKWTARRAGRLRSWLNVLRTWQRSQARALRRWRLVLAARAARRRRLEALARGHVSMQRRELLTRWQRVNGSATVGPLDFDLDPYPVNGARDGTWNPGVLVARATVGGRAFVGALSSIGMYQIFFILSYM